MNVLLNFLKIAVPFLFCTALLLQGCAMNKSNMFCAGATGCTSDNPEVDGRWNQYAQEVNPELARGNRIAADGRTVFTPVHGAGVNGIFQTPDGRRIVHDRDCQKEGGGSEFFWGWVVPVGSLFLPTKIKIGPALGQTASNAARQHGSTARFYTCEDAKEFFAGGNTRLLQGEIENYRTDCTAGGGTFALDSDTGEGSCTTPTISVASQQASQTQVVVQSTPAPAVGATSAPSTPLDAWCRANASCPLGQVGVHTGQVCQCQ